MELAFDVFERNAVLDVCYPLVLVASKSMLCRLIYDQNIVNVENVVNKLSFGKV